MKQADYGSVNVNLFGIRQHECPAARPTCDPLTSLTLVMPLEITVDRDAVLVINDRGKDLAPIPLRIVPDKIHILNSCDTAAIFIGVAQEAQGRCAPILQSRNGRLISRENPARPGDTVVAWAYGIGFSGRRAQPPNFELSNVPNPPELFFNFRANAGVMRRIRSSRRTAHVCGRARIMGTLPDELRHPRDPFRPEPPDVRRGPHRLEPDGVGRRSDFERQPPYVPPTVAGAS